MYINEALAYQRLQLLPCLRLIAAILAAGLFICSLPGALHAKPAFSTIAIDARSGKVLFARNADSLRYPASLTKVMTLYLLFEDLRDGKIGLSGRFKVSKLAARQAPSKLGMKPGQTIRVKDAIGALVTKSANDVAVVVAENLSGSVPAFAGRMTDKARQLGMTRTTFRNPSGLPDPSQKTTARDMATLALRVQRDFPTYYKYFKLRSYKYGKRAYRNHNRLLGRVKGVDGIKTGYTRASGFNLTTSAKRNGKRIVAVVMGGKTGRSRNAYMTKLLERLFKSKKLTRGTHLALVAGDPPGYKKSQETLVASAQSAVPKPRTKPQNDDAEIARISQAAALQSLSEKAEPAGSGKDQSRLDGATFVAVSVPDATDGAKINELSSSDKLGLLVTATAAKGNQLDVLEKQETIQQAVEASASASLEPNPQAAEPALKDKSSINDEIVEHLSTWNIQIGAFPTRDGARGRLDQAKERAARSLVGKKPFLMPTEKNGETLYRARFSGFNRSSANKACKALSRKGVSCFTLAPRS